MDNNPPRPAENLPRPKELTDKPRTRGIRSGKAAQRKRKAYLRFALELNPDLSPDEVLIVHADGSRRPLYSRSDWTPDRLNDDDEVPNTPPPSWYVPGATAKASVSSDYEIPEPKTPPEAASSSSARAPTLPPKPKIRTAPAKASGAVPVEDVEESQAVGAVPVEDVEESQAVGAGPVLIPKAAGVAGYHRLNLPPAPIRPVSVPAKSPSVPAKVSVPAKESVPVKAIPKGPPPKVPAPPRGPPPISSDSFGDGTLLLSPITNHKCRLEGEARDSVKRVLLLDFHNTLDRYFTPGRKQQHAIPWPSTRPTLLPEVTDFVKHCITAASQNESFTCVVVLSHIHRSQENEAWLRDTIHNTLEEVGEIGDTERCLFDLLIVSRERIGPKGKLSVAKRVFPSAEFLIIDDNIEVATEFIRGGQQSFHIRLPKRDSSPLGRSYANILETEQAAISWIRRPFTAEAR